MPNDEMVKPEKLSFSDRFKKMRLMRKLTVEEYLNAPINLQNDSDVIEKLMSKSARNLEHLPIAIGLRYLEVHPEIIAENSKKVRDTYVDERPELFNYLTEDQQLQLIFIDNKYSFIKMLSKEQQRKILIGKFEKEIWVEGNTFSKSYLIEFKRDQSNCLRDINNSQLGKLIVNPEFFIDKINLFDEEVILEALEKYSKDYNEKNEKSRYANNDKERKKYFEYLTAQKIIDEIIIQDLPIDLQLKLALVDNRLIKGMSIEALEIFVGDNPLLLNMLPKEKKEKIILEHPEFIRTLSRDEQKKYIGNPELEKYVPARNADFKWNKYAITDYESIIKKSVLGENIYWDFSYITDSLRDQNKLWEVAKTIPQALAVTGLTGNTFKYNSKTMHVKELLNQKIENEQIKSAINHSKLFNYSFDDSFENMQTQLAILKVLTDDKVIKSCDSELIVQFIYNPRMETLREIVGQTYGDKAKQILESRPELSFEHIPNLRIFDEVIFENFGEGEIHNQLSYNTKSSIILADMANHPEKIEQYKKFERLTKGLFKEDIAGKDESYRAFIELYDFISKINESEMNKERIETLKLIILDLDFPEMQTIPLNSVEDLDKYVESRNKIYDDAAKKTTDTLRLKDILSRRIFGMKYEERINDLYNAYNLSLNGMIHYYNVDNLLKDKRTYESELFTTDELDMMELARIIDKIDDPKVLSQIYEALSKEKEILGPVEFESIKQKIPLQYSKELVSQLLTPEKAQKMVEEGKEGIEIEHREDGIDVIKLKGADFKIMMHSMLGIDGRGNNSGLDIPMGKTPSEIWKYFEDGCSTISTCVIEPDMMKSCGTNTGTFNIGICSVDPRLILGMSHHDAHVSHLRRNPNPNFQYTSVEMNYPEELLRKTAAQITGQEVKDSTHEYNEVALYRRTQELSEITSENYGGRVFPDYIVVYGKSNDLHRELARAFSKDGKPIPIIEIDMECYRNNMYWRGRQEDKEHQITEKDESELVKKVKTITEEER